MEESLRMRLEQEASPTKLLSRNAGKVVAAFLTGFAVFTAIVSISVRMREGRPAIGSSPIRGNATTLTIQAAPETLVLNPLSNAPVLILPNLTIPADSSSTNKVSPRRRARKETQIPAKVETQPMAQPATRDAPLTSAAPQAPPPMVAAENPPRMIPAETTIVIRTLEILSTRESRTGEGFQGVLAAPVVADGIEILPQGTTVSGRIVESRRAGLFGRHSVLSLEVTAVTAKGHAVPLKTTQWYTNGSGSRLRKAFRGKGRDNGSDSAIAESKGGDVNLPASSTIKVRLMAPATIP